VSTYTELHSQPTNRLTMDFDFKCCKTKSPCHCATTCNNLSDSVFKNC